MLCSATSSDLTQSAALLLGGAATVPRSTASLLEQAAAASYLFPSPAAASLYVPTALPSPYLQINPADHTAIYRLATGSTTAAYLPGSGLTSVHPAAAAASILSAAPAATAALLYPNRSKRVRTAFTPSQLSRLENQFYKNPYVVGQQRKQISDELGLSETQVKVWFQNRRTKEKRISPSAEDDESYEELEEKLRGSQEEASRSEDTAFGHSPTNCHVTERIQTQFEKSL